MVKGRYPCRVKRFAVPDRRWLIWMAVAVAFLGFIAADAFADAFFGDLGCELAPGSSIYGDLSWSLHRLGSKCSYLIGENHEYVDRPSALRPAALIGLVLWAWTLRRPGLAAVVSR